LSGRELSANQNYNKQNELRSIRLPQSASHYS
jgi:hypothetical protein